MGWDGGTSAAVQKATALRRGRERQGLLLCMLSFHPLRASLFTLAAHPSIPTTSPAQTPATSTGVSAGIHV